MTKIDYSEEALDRVRFMQRIGMASAGRPVGTINGVPIVEVDEILTDGDSETQPIAVPREQ